MRKSAWSEKPNVADAVNKPPKVYHPKDIHKLSDNELNKRMTICALWIHAVNDVKKFETDNDLDSWARAISDEKHRSILGANLQYIKFERGKAAHDLTYDRESGVVDKMLKYINFNRARFKEYNHSKAPKQSDDVVHETLCYQFGKWGELQKARVEELESEKHALKVTNSKLNKRIDPVEKELAVALEKIAQLEREVMRLTYTLDGVKLCHPQQVYEKR